MIKILICSLGFLGLVEIGYCQQNQAISTALDAPYPKIRIWTSPSKGEEPRFNSPSFQWPSTKKATYSVRVSTSKDFGSNLIEKQGIPFAMFNPHIQLKQGKWYWQFNPLAQFQ